jgi:hypothetical protein
MLGKYILPWFGSGPAVWTTCMLLLSGVPPSPATAYAHVRQGHLSAHNGAVIHLCLPLLTLLLLPITPSAAPKPIDPSSPAQH